jgi:hypothetical protein
MPIGPHDVEENASPAWRMAYDSLCARIDNELQRQHYTGGSPAFVLPLAEHMSDGLKASITRAYNRLWDSVDIHYDAGQAMYFITIWGDTRGQLKSE